jgi:hypothetical protein
MTHQAPAPALILAAVVTGTGIAANVVRRAGGVETARGGA